MRLPKKQDGPPLSPLQANHLLTGQAVSHISQLTAVSGMITLLYVYYVGLH